jgi:predicted DNA-binding transcriptional regulator AlpA
MKPRGAAMTIAEFCARFAISRPLYFRMRAAGDGPQELRLGRRKIVITEQAARQWLQRHGRQAG